MNKVKFLNLAHAVDAVRQDYYFRDLIEETDIDIDDFFIAERILRIVNQSIGWETVGNVLSTGPVGMLMQYLEDDYKSLEDELKTGDFWDYYTEDLDNPVDFDFEIFRRAVRMAGSLNIDIHLTNCRDDEYKTEILSYYRGMFSSTTQ